MKSLATKRKYVTWRDTLEHQTKHELMEQSLLTNKKLQRNDRLGAVSSKTRGDFNSGVYEISTFTLNSSAV